MRQSQEAISADDLQITVDSLSAVGKLFDVMAPMMKGFMPGIAKEQIAITQAKFERLMVEYRRQEQTRAAQEAMKKQAAQQSPGADEPQRHDAESSPTTPGTSAIVTKGKKTKGAAAAASKKVI